MKNGKETFLCLLLTIVMLTCGFWGCSKAQPKNQYDNKLDITNMQPQNVTQKIIQLGLPNEIRMSMSVIHDIDTLKKEGIVDTIRYNKNRYYSVTPLEKNQYLFLLYNDNGDSLYVVDGFLASTLVDKTVFQDIAVGMTQEDILKRDPSSCIFEKYSYHRFSDKSIFRIKYERNSENKYLVSEYDYIENSESVLNFLLQQDMDKIVK